MSLVAFSTRRPVTVFIFAMAAVVFGAVAFRQLAVDLLPDITYPSLTVQTEFEGAAPAEVESLVTKPIEDAIGVVNNVVRVTSSSRADISEVTLEFGWGTNMDFASLDVRERLDVVRLPLEVEKPVLLRFDPSLDPVLRLGLVGDEDMVRLRIIAEDQVKRALERVDGVAAAIVSGGLEEEIQVELDERRIASVGLSVNELRLRLAQENINLTGGRLLDGQTEFLVRTVNELLRPEDLRSLVVGRRGDASIRLTDVATVRKGTKEREIITRIDGRESVEVAIYKEGGTNTVAVVDEVLSTLDDLGVRLRRFDPDLELVAITDQARFIRESVQAVIDTAALGGLLAIVILYLFLRSVRNTLIIGISIPVSVMATFFLMYIADVSLNVMSLGGLTLGIGLLLDNSIVVLEAIQRKREEGLPIAEAARVGASEVSQAVTASTLTTVCVFAPIVFVEGIAGQLFGDQALTVTFSLLVSLLVALTVIPMLASRQGIAEVASGVDSGVAGDGEVPRSRWYMRMAMGIGVAVVGFVKGVGRTVARLGRLAVQPILVAFDAGLQVIRRSYRVSLQIVLRHPWPTLLVALLVVFSVVPFFDRLGRELVPELVQGEFFADLELLPGTRLEVTDRRIAEVERGAAGLDGVRTVYSIVGASNEQGGSAGERRENIGQLTVVLEPGRDRGGEDAVMEQLRAGMEAANAAYAAPDAGSIDTAAPVGSDPNRMEYRFGRPSYFTFRTPIEIEVRGYNLALLQRLATQVVATLQEIEGITDVNSSTEGGNPELQIRFDRERLAALGLSVGELGELLRTKIQGNIATDILREDRNIEIRVRSHESFRDSVRDLEQINIARGGNANIPLAAVADIVETIGPAEIRRSDGSRVATITANLIDRDLGSVAEEIEERLAQIQWPLGFDWSVGGQQQEMQTSFDSMRTAIALAIFMVYLVMASQFESLLHPFVILFSVPFSVVGAVLALILTGTSLSVVVLIGAILLAGIVVNNAIILIDTTNRLRRDGATKVEALLEAGQMRLRPILMTTSTTVLGLLPMAAGLGQGSELRSPMAITVVGGLLTSTLLTLLLVPTLYRVLDRRA